MNPAVSASSHHQGFIFLYGPPGSGKSTLGIDLADSISMPFVDLDDRISKTAGKSIPEIFNDEGEMGFRKREKTNLEDILSGPPTLVALGGGTLLDPKNRILAEESGVILLLEAPIEVLVQRLQKTQTIRPLLVPDLFNDLEKILSSRSSHYNSFPYRLNTMDRASKALIWEAQKKLGRFYVKGMGDGYPAYFQPGCLGKVGSMLSDAGVKGPIALVTDTNVSDLYGEQLLKALASNHPRTFLIRFPPGEDQKNLGNVQTLWSELFKLGVERSSTVISLGGGVISDLTGFACSTILRGIQWIAIPTTLLAMVDASLGGKTGINLTQGKNLAGTFYPPKMVLCDPKTLQTLPDEEFRTGIAEMIKHAVIADPDLFDVCNRGITEIKKMITQIIPQAMAVKIHLIQTDPYERGDRALLNLGHTIGHGIEKATKYQVKHGDAVAIGLVKETQIAENMGIAQTGLTDTIKQCLQASGLPIEYPIGLNQELFFDALGYDKKKSSGRLHFTLPIRIGKVVPNQIVDMGLIEF